MLGEDVPLLVALPEPFVHLSRQVQLLLQPQRHGLDEGPEAYGRVTHIRLEQALELEQRLVVETDVVQLLRLQAGMLQAVLDGVDREAVVVLLAREAFFLRGGDDLSVDDQCSRRVVVESRDTQNGN